MKSDYSIVNKIMGSPGWLQLPGVYKRRGLNLDAQDNGQGLLKAQVNILLKQIICLRWDYRP